MRCASARLRSLSQSIFGGLPIFEERRLDPLLLLQHEPEGGVEETRGKLGEQSVFSGRDPAPLPLRKSSGQSLGERLLGPQQRAGVQIAQVGQRPAQSAGSLPLPRSECRRADQGDSLPGHPGELVPELRGGQRGEPGGH